MNAGHFLRVSRRVRLWALVTSVGIVAGGTQAKAAFILDDFDVPSSHSPFYFQEGHPTTSDAAIVGELHLRRKLQYGAIGAEPTGHFDSAITAPSRLTATIEEANPQEGFTQIGHRLLYALDFSTYVPFDISQSGRNDAFIFDFERLEGTRPPDQLRFYVGAHGTRYEYRHFDFSLTSEPFSIVIPFSSFFERGGGPPPPVPAFTDTQLIDLDFLSGSSVEQFVLVLDRIRVGSAVVVPEPAGLWLAPISLVVLLPFVAKGGHRALFLSRCVTLMAVGLLAGGTGAKAAFILDDFDVPSSHSPYYFQPDHPTNSERTVVGELNLDRVLQYGAIGAEPVGQFDSAITDSSRLTATIEQANTQEGFTQISHRLLYGIDVWGSWLPFDLSQSGRNDAFIFDFERLEGTRPPDQLRIYVGAHRTTYEYRHFDLPLSSEPFSIVIPFASFFERGGGPPPPVPGFTDTQIIDLDFISGSRAEQFVLVLDRIRVGSAAVVPEPAGVWLAPIGLIVLLPFAAKGSWRAIPISRCVILMAVVGLSMGTTQANAAFILDDFDVPSSHSPFYFQEGHPTTSELTTVGEMSLERALQYGAISAEPLGRFDSAITAPSQLTATIDQANVLGGFVQIDHRLLYGIDVWGAWLPFDLSQGGRNDTFIFDFERLEGTRPPDQLRIYVGAHGTTYEYRHFDLPLSSEPFSLAIPFASFFERGGGPPPPVPAFTDTQIIDLAFRSGSRAEQYELVLDRIRVGSAAVIPEPVSIWIALISLVVLLAKGSVAARFLGRQKRHA